jgi:Recombinase zinc beta ribbon domain
MLRNPIYKADGAWSKGHTETMDGVEVARHRVPEEHRLRFQVPAIIDAPTWERAQELAGMDLRRPPEGSRTYLLKGSMRCASCGASYAGSGQQEGVHYYAHRKEGNGCQGVRVRASWVEDAIWRQVITFANEPGEVLHELSARINEKRTGAGSLEARLQHAEKKLRAARAAHDRVASATIDLLASGSISKEVAEKKLASEKEKVNQVEKERQRIAAEVAAAARQQEALASAAELLQHLREVVHDAPPEVRRKVIERLVENIEVSTIREPGKRPRPEVDVHFIFQEPAPSALSFTQAHAWVHIVQKPPPV